MCGHQSSELICCDADFLVSEMSSVCKNNSTPEYCQLFVNSRTCYKCLKIVIFVVILATLLYAVFQMNRGYPVLFIFRNVFVLEENLIGCVAQLSL